MLRFSFTIFLALLNILWITCFVHFRTKAIQNTPLIELKIQEDTFDIQSIDLQIRDNKTHFQFDKINDKWLVKNPITWEANPLAISDLLQNLNYLKPELSFKANTHEDLNIYGLSIPFITLKCSTSKHTYTLNFSDPLKANHKVYVLEVETNKIFILNSNFINCLLLSLEQWCTPSIFSFNSLQSLTFKAPSQKLYLDYNQGIWHLKIPSEIKANQQHVKTVCQQLLQLECKHFLTSDEVKDWFIPFSQDTHLYHVTINNDNASCTLKFLPYDEKNRLFVAQRNNSGPLFLFQSTFVERLLNPQETLRERILFNIDLQNTQKIIYENSDTLLTLQPLTENQWEVLQKGNDNFIQSQKASLNAIKRFVHILNNIYVENFIQSTIDFEHCKQFHLTLHEGDISTKATFFIYEKNFYAKFDNDPTLFQLTTLNEQVFKKTLEDFQDKTLWVWKPDEKISSVELLTPKGNSIAIQLNDHDKAVLSRLTVKEWIDHDLKYPIFNHNNYTLIIETLDSANINQKYTLQFSERIGGNLQSGKYLSQRFLFPQEWIDLLFKFTHLPVWNKTFEDFYKIL